MNNRKFLIVLILLLIPILMGCEQKYDSNSWKTILPNSCKHFFDGCNNCQKIDNDIASCTKKGCAKYQKPECLDKTTGTVETTAATTTGESFK